MSIESKNLLTETNSNTRVLVGTQAEIDAKYTKPSSGIPKTDLASSVQTSLGRADTALQSFTETDPVWSGVNTTSNAVDAFQNTTDIKLGKKATKIRIGKINDTSYTGGVSIGENSYTTSYACALGYTARGTKNYATALGYTSYASGTSSIAIGAGLANQSYSISIGPSSESRGEYGVALGANAKVNGIMSTVGSRATAIGYKAIVNADDAIQLGEGTNSTASSLQFRNTKIVNAFGKIPTASLELKDRGILTSESGSSNPIALSRTLDIYKRTVSSNITLGVSTAGLALGNTEMFAFEIWLTLATGGSVTIPSTWVCVGTALDVTAGHTAYLACRVDNTGTVMYNQYYKA